MMRSAAHRCKRARNNVKFLDLPPSLRRPYILTAYRTNHDLRSCLLSLFQVSCHTRAPPGHSHPPPPPTRRLAPTLAHSQP